MAGVRAYGSTLKRHVSAEIDPQSTVSLDERHPAVVEGRTLFPSTVEPSTMSPRFLVSGVNSPKLGRMVTKGARAGWPIYHLTLEERATCPRSCEQWRGCYGNAMHHARRHVVDDDFMFLLKAEVVTLARQHDAGFLVRLHTLGDFPSVPYVETWDRLLTACPSLHIFGYTARRADDQDPASAAIADALARATSNHGWERFAIRTSTSEPGPRSRAVVVDEDPATPGVILCPEQKGETEACGSCGLCWAPAARDKTIAFLRHGMKRSRGPRLVEAAKPSRPRVVAAAASGAPEQLLAAMEEAAGGGTILRAHMGQLLDAARLHKKAWTGALGALVRQGRVQVVEEGRTKRPGTYRLLERRP